MFGWPPAVFWAATPQEFFACLDGHLEKNQGGKKKMEHSRLADLIEEGGGYKVTSTRDTGVG